MNWFWSFSLSLASLLLASSYPPCLSASLSYSYSNKDRSESVESAASFEAWKDFAINLPFSQVLPRSTSELPLADLTRAEAFDLLEEQLLSEAFTDAQNTLLHLHSHFFMSTSLKLLCCNRVLDSEVIRNAVLSQFFSEKERLAGAIRDLIYFDYPEDAIAFLIEQYWSQLLQVDGSRLDSLRRLFRLAVMKLKLAVVDELLLNLQTRSSADPAAFINHQSTADEYPLPHVLVAYFSDAEGLVLEDAIQMLQLLCTYGFNVNVQDSAGRTPLHVAIFLKSAPFREVLKECGARGDAWYKGFPASAWIAAFAGVSSPRILPSFEECRRQSHSARLQLPVAGGSEEVPLEQRGRRRRLMRRPRAINPLIAAFTTEL